MLFVQHGLFGIDSKRKRTLFFSTLLSFVNCRMVFLEKVQSASNTAGDIGACPFLRTPHIRFSKSFFSVWFVFSLHLSSLRVVSMTLSSQLCARCIGGNTWVELNCGTKYVFCHCWLTSSKNHRMCFADVTGLCSSVLHYYSCFVVVRRIMSMPEVRESEVEVPLGLCHSIICKGCIFIRPHRRLMSISYIFDILF